MLNELRFVKGAVGTKNFIPELKHFKIQNGHIRSYNGTLALSSPIALDINCVPEAIPFVKAIQNCEETVSLKMTPAGRLSIKSGPFRAYINCIEEETPHVEPEGEMFEINGEKLLKAFKTVMPFIGNDASRPWSSGVLLCGQSAFATNNRAVIEYWVGSDFPQICNVPMKAIREVLRINEAPIAAQMTKNSISFHYESKRWIRTQLLELGWPDVIDLLNSLKGNPGAMPTGFFEGLEVLRPFTDQMGRVYFLPGRMATHITEGEGACYAIDGLPQEAAFQIEILEALKDVANVIDFGLYPRCPFYGDRLRGVISGLRI